MQKKNQMSLERMMIFLLNERNIKNILSPIFGNKSFRSRGSEAATRSVL